MIFFFNPVTHFRSSLLLALSGTSHFPSVSSLTRKLLFMNERLANKRPFHTDCPMMLQLSHIFAFFTQIIPCLTLRFLIVIWHSERINRSVMSAVIFVQQAALCKYWNNMTAIHGRWSHPLPRYEVSPEIHFVSTVYVLLWVSCSLLLAILNLPVVAP